MRVLVAGATGVVGRQLVPQLVEAGHQVTATTRSAGKADELRRLGAEPAVVDGLDAVAVGEAVARAEPEVVVHQMTGLAGAFDLRHFDRTFAATNKLRTTGTDHLLAAARAAGTRRVIVQSYAGWTNSMSGGPVKDEDDPFEPNPPKAVRPTQEAIKYIESAVATSPMEGVALRYGNLYGPGASDLMVDMLKKRQVPIISDGGGVWSFLHVQDAASAAVAALAAAPGVYNVTDDEPAQVREWLPVLASAVGARPPLRVPAWIGRLAGGEAAVAMMTRVRGSSNARFKRETGWQPAWPTWRDGFVHGLHSVTASNPPWDSGGSSRRTNTAR